MKKILLIIILTAIITTGIFAENEFVENEFAENKLSNYPGGLGIGLQIGGGSKWESAFMGTAAVTLKIRELPFLWGIRLNIENDYFSLGISSDYYLADILLIPDNLHWYIGLGAELIFGLNDPFSTGIAARAPIGLSWQKELPSIVLEVYLQVVPKLGLSIYPFDFPYGGLGIDLGVRIWFD